MGSHATWYSRGLADGAGLALGLPPQWTVTAIHDAGATHVDYAAYARARTEAAERTRRVIARRRADEQWRRDTAAFLAAHRVREQLRWFYPNPLRLVGV